MLKFPLVVFILPLVSGCVQGATYTNTASIKGQSFLDAFYFQSIPDPTWGRINYVNQTVAEQKGLYTVTDDTFTVRVDSKTVLKPNGPGRDSFRLMSNLQYAHHVAIFDISHIPVGCGTWPAICEWLEVGYDWPNGGEIDIFEGVNGVGTNQVTIHTSGNCNMPPGRCMTGKDIGDACTAYGGCPVIMTDPKSFGPSFNANGGGWYVIERSPSAVSVWFFERTSSSVPSGVRNPGKTVDTSTFGEPAAYFPNTDCDFTTHLKSMNIIVNCDLCGAWAGAVYTADKCPGSCVDLVNNNPGAFTDAYFEFRSLNIYE